MSSSTPASAPLPEPVAASDTEPTSASAAATTPADTVALRLPRHPIEKRAVWWWMVRAIVTWGLLLTALIVAAVIWEPARVWLVTPIIIVAAITLARLLVEPWWRFRVHRWEIGEHATYAVSGWIVKEWRVAPSSRIQTVDAVRGPLEQLFGLSTLRVTTASSYGAISVPGLARDTADSAVEQLATVAEVTPGDAT